MFQAVIRAATALLLPLALTSCFLTPGKFTSTLTINADRSFAYAYQGEVIAFDLGKEMADGLKDLGGDAKGPGDAEASDSAFHPTAADAREQNAAAKKVEFDRKCRAIAEALTKEAGYRRAEYLGDGKFAVDYAISGKLTHNFVYPFNLDAIAVFPFVAIELRADGRVRVKAPAFAKDNSSDSPMAGLGDGPGLKADGTFTLDTDAEIVSQNNEAGATTVGGRKRVVWTVTPLSTAAPTAVLGLR